MALKIHCDRCDKSAPTTIAGSSVNLPNRWTTTTIDARWTTTTIDARSGSDLGARRQVTLCPTCDQSLSRWFSDGDPQDVQPGGAS